MLVDQEVKTQQRPSFLAYAQKHRAVGEADDIWQDLARRVKEGKIIPILSNSLRDDRFLHLFGLADRSMAAFISESWAASPQVQYPMSDAQNLPRVAQYYQVTAGNPEKAKRDFLDFMVQGLLGFALDTDPLAAAAIEEKNLANTPDLLFADLVAELGYPPVEEGEEDLMNQLAKLRLPIYITTSYYDFLERALIADGRKRVRSEVCTWSGQISKIDREYLPSPTEPTPDEPLVFHLFGMERYPHTMVLSVDDYLNFLVNIFLRETDAKTSQSKGAPPPIPAYLWERIVELPLLIMGFQLHDWDFQVLYRGIVTAKPTVAQRDAGVVIQLKPDQQSGFTDPARAEEYLRNYLSQEVKFAVKFSTPDEFIDKLYKTFKQRS
jgi:hypothetical protein